MSKIQTTLIRMTLPIMLLTAGLGRCQSLDDMNDRQKAAVSAVQRLGGEITDYTDPETGESANIFKDKALPLWKDRQFTVTFANSELTDADLISLSAQLETINPKKLDLRLTKVTGAFCGYMNLPKLADLDLSSTLVDDSGLQQLVNPLSAVWCNPKPDETFRLRLNYINLSLRGLKQFVSGFKTTGPKNLVLCVSGITVTDENGQRVSATGILNTLTDLSSKLTGLDLSNTSLGRGDLGPNLGCLVCFENLTRLGLANNKLQDDDFDKFPTISKPFKALNLSGNSKISNPTLKQLTTKLNLTDLRILLLSDTQITTRGLAELLPRVSSLRRLELKNTFTILKLSKSHNVFGAEISPFPSLAILDVSGTGVSDDELPAIGTLPKLGNLDLSNTVVTNKGIERLARERPSLPPPTVILTDTKALQKAANALLDAIRFEGVSPQDRLFEGSHLKGAQVPAL